MINPRAKSFIAHYVIAAIPAVALFGFLLSQRALVHKLNWQLFYQGAVTFTTGAMIALFIAIFYSSQTRMTFLRNHPQARTLYFIFVVNLIAIVVTGAFIGATLPHALVIELAAAVIMVTLTVDLAVTILRLIKIGVGQP